VLHPDGEKPNVIRCWGEQEVNIDVIFNTAINSGKNNTLPKITILTTLMLTMSNTSQSFFDISRVEYKHF
jgi:hypothetical protein